MVKNYLILWSDIYSEPHVRLLRGTEAEADRALELLREAHADHGDGWRDGRVLEAGAEPFVGLAVIEEETAVLAGSTGLDD